MGGTARYVNMTVARTGIGIGSDHLFMFLLFQVTDMTAVILPRCPRTGGLRGSSSPVVDLPSVGVHPRPRVVRTPVSCMRLVRRLRPRLIGNMTGTTRFVPTVTNAMILIFLSPPIARCQETLGRGRVPWVVVTKLFQIRLRLAPFMFEDRIDCFLVCLLSLKMSRNRRPISFHPIWISLL